MCEKRTCRGVRKVPQGEGKIQQLAIHRGAFEGGGGELTKRYSNRRNSCEKFVGVVSFGAREEGEKERIGYRTRFKKKVRSQSPGKDRVEREDNWGNRIKKSSEKKLQLTQRRTSRKKEIPGNAPNSLR